MAGLPGRWPIWDIVCAIRRFGNVLQRFQNAVLGGQIFIPRQQFLVHRPSDVGQIRAQFMTAPLVPTYGVIEIPSWQWYNREILERSGFLTLRLPLSEAARVADETTAPDDQLEYRQQAAKALAAIATLPASLREPATLFFVHECSHQDIATFLSLPVATVNNRLHAARVQLKQRMLTMVSQTLQAHGLPDNFADRIGRLIEVRGNVVDALFDPTAMPDILAELEVSDEANRRAINLQVVQRLGAGMVRGIATSSIAALPRGSTVLNSGHHTRTPFPSTEFERTARLLSAGVTRGLPADVQGKLLETGIKVIDVRCPLVAGGTVVIAGDLGAGMLVVMEELVRRLGGGSDPLSIFVMMPPPSPEWPYSLEPVAEVRRANAYEPRSTRRLTHWSPMRETQAVGPSVGSASSPVATLAPRNIGRFSM
jgi:hypothetical protein